MTDNRTTELLRKLRKMLDGCRRTETMGFDTYWITADALDSSLEELEQAIAATLGRGECEIETKNIRLPARRYHRCKNCGAFFAVMNASGDIPPCACPNCGKAVKR